MTKPTHRSATYRYEYEMADDAAPLVSTVLFDSRRRRGLLTVREVDALESVPDITVVRLDPEWVDRREQLEIQPLVSPSEVDVVLALKRRARTVSSLAQATGLSEQYITRRLLPALSEKGWLIHDKAGALLVEPWYRAVTRVVTVETKLRDWRRAAWQAKSQQWSSDASYVCIDASRANPAVNARETLREAGVGLLTMDRGAGRLRLISRPARSLEAWQRARGKLLHQERVLAQRAGGRSDARDRPIFGWSPVRR